MARRYKLPDFAKLLEWAFTCASDFVSLTRMAARGYLASPMCNLTCKLIWVSDS